MSARALALSVAIVFAASAGSPFVGKWKLNPEKSQFTGTTVGYERLPSGDIRTTAEGQSYTFRTDGKEYPAWFGMTAAWKEVGPTAWEVTYRLKNRLMSTDTIRLSADGKTLAWNSKGQLPDGTPFNDSATYERVSGGPGLEGTWKSAKVTISVPLTIELGSHASGGLTWTVPSINLSTTIQFDGKDYPLEGPTVPPNFTIAATSRGPRSFELVQKLNAKVAYRSTFTLSDDGKTLTVVSSVEGTRETVTAVYDRQ